MSDQATRFWVYMYDFVRPINELVVIPPEDLSYNHEKEIDKNNI